MPLCTGPLAPDAPRQPATSPRPRAPALAALRPRRSPAPFLRPRRAASRLTASTHPLALLCLRTSSRPAPVESPAQRPPAHREPRPPTAAAPLRSPPPGREPCAHRPPAHRGHALRRQLRPSAAPPPREKRPCVEPPSFHTGRMPLQSDAVGSAPSAPADGSSTGGPMPPLVAASAPVRPICAHR